MSCTPGSTNPVIVADGGVQGDPEGETGATIRNRYKELAEKPGIEIIF
ncbi:MAG: hypothetical protein ABSG28_08100 [Methanoregula sp.]